MTVKNLLKGKGRFVPSVRSDSTINDVIDQLETDDAGALVVTDDDLEILGIISERDVVRGLKLKGRDFLDTPISEVMSSPVFVCEHDQPLTSVMALMDENQIRHIPIVENGELCGIVNMLDLVKHRLEELEFEAGSLKQYVAGRA